jgi:hypothetical protein
LTSTRLADVNISEFKSLLISTLTMETKLLSLYEKLPRSELLCDQICLLINGFN